MPEDPYAAIADLYDFAYSDFDDDIDFYENLARAVGGPVRGRGVGSGRAAVPLAEAGYEVVGIDTSPSMLARAGERLAATKLTKGRLDLLEVGMTCFAPRRRAGRLFSAA